jgi:hypothetical protein
MKKENKKNWKNRYWEMIDKSGFLTSTPPCYVDWEKVEKFIEQTIVKVRKDVKKRTIRKIHKLLFKDLYGEPLDDREAILSEKYPFID